VRFFSAQSQSGVTSLACRMDWSAFYDGCVC